MMFALDRLLGRPLQFALAKTLPVLDIHPLDNVTAVAKNSQGNRGGKCTVHLLDAGGLLQPVIGGRQPS